MAITRKEAEEVTSSFLTDYPGPFKLAYRIRAKIDELYGPNAIKAPEGFKRA